MDEQESEDPGSEWELALIGRNEQEVGLSDFERLRLTLVVETPAQMFQHLLVFAYLNQDGITLSEKPHPVGMPGLEESTVTASSSSCHRYTRLERLFYCVNRYLDIIKIDTSIYAHRCIIYSIVVAMSDGLKQKFPYEMFYMDNALPDLLLPPTYFGFGRLGHLCYANLLAFHCLSLWKDHDVWTILDPNFRHYFRYHRIDMSDILPFELMQWVRAADADYEARGFDCPW